MRIAVLVLVVALSPACTKYTYYSRTTQPDSTGQPRELLASWHVTERKLWFDGSSEGVALKLACSTATMDFEEQPQGIVMRSDGTWSGAREEGGVAICGRVPGVQHVKDIKPGQSISVELWCQPLQDDEFASPTPYLPPKTYALSAVQRTEQESVDVGECEAADAQAATRAEMP